MRVFKARCAPSTTQAKCSMCGKMFDKYPGHTYKAPERKVFCSYHCYNAYQKEQEEKFMKKHWKEFL